MNALQKTEGLQFIADFLNHVHGDMTRDAWRAYLKRHIAMQRKKGFRLTLGPLAGFRGDGRLVASVTLREAKQVRQMVKSDLRYLEFDRDRIQTTEAPLGPLLLHLSEHFQSGAWRCAPVRSAQPDPGQAVLQLKRRDGKVERWAASFSPFGDVRTFQEWVYMALGQALLSGQLGRLKLCRNGAIDRESGGYRCGRYFVAAGKAAKRLFCSPACKEGASGGSARVQQWRQVKRELRIVEARNMRRKEKSIAEIQAKTKLPNRVLQKLFGEGAV